MQLTVPAQKPQPRATVAVHEVHQPEANHILQEVVQEKAAVTQAEVARARHVAVIQAGAVRVLHAVAVIQAVAAHVHQVAALVEAQAVQVAQAAAHRAADANQMFGRDFI